MSKIIPIDWKQVGDLLKARCSGSQIADSLGIHENTLYERCRTDLGLDFVAFKAQKRAEGNNKILKTQYEVATIDKDKSMLIWWGKNYLGQKDRTEIDHKNDGGPFDNKIEVVFRDFTEDKEVENIKDNE